MYGSPSAHVCISSCCVVLFSTQKDSSLSFNKLKFVTRKTVKLIDDKYLEIWRSMPFFLMINELLSILLNSVLTFTVPLGIVNCLMGASTSEVSLLSCHVSKRPEMSEAFSAGRY
jgi:hypothetical protein